jgi:hypothetical protein
MRCSALALAFALCAPGLCHAETLEQLRARIAGVEVDVTGHIGTGLDLMDDEALAFRDSAGTGYNVVFDAGREARKALEGCEFAMFGGGSPCAITAKAEIEWDGSNLRLIIFEVVSIAPPTPL